MKVIKKKTSPKSKRGAEAAEREKAKQKENFLHWYRQGGAIYWSAAKIGLSVDTIDRWRTADAVFDKAVLDAYADSTDTLKMTAYMRALKGSDNLLMFLTKQRDPSFRDHYEARLFHGGSIANPSRVPASVQAAVEALSLDLVKKMAEKL